MSRTPPYSCLPTHICISWESQTQPSCSSVLFWGGLFMREDWVGSQVWSWTVKPWKGCVSWSPAIGALAISCLWISACWRHPPRPASSIGVEDITAFGTHSSSFLTKGKRSISLLAQAWQILVKGQWLTWLGFVLLQGLISVPRAVENSDWLSSSHVPFLRSISCYRSPHLVLRIMSQNNVCSEQTKYWMFPCRTRSNPASFLNPSGLFIHYEERATEHPSCGRHC